MYDYNSFKKQQRFFLINDEGNECDNEKLFNNNRKYGFTVRAVGGYRLFIVGKTLKLPCTTSIVI